MKQRSTTPVSIKKLAKKSALITAALLMAFTVPTYVSPNVEARNYDAEINALLRQAEGYQGEADKLRREADSLKNAVSKLETERQVIQTQIDLGQAKKNKLEEQIKDAQDQIDQNALVSGEIINDMAITDDEPMFMQLATSDNLADVIDAFENQLTVQKELKRSTDETKVLKKQIEDQKVEVERILADQKIQEENLAAKQAEQQNLLNETSGREEEYKKLVNEKNSQVSQLREQQSAAMRAARSSGGGMSAGSNMSSGYPYLGASMNYNDSCIYPNGTSGADEWGYCLRQCVSYVAWKLANDGLGNRGFSYLGHAGNWSAGGTPVYSNIKPGDVIVWHIGHYGHVVYVEKVFSDGRIYYSQANANWSGQVSDGWTTVSDTFNGPYSVRRFN